MRSIYVPLPEGAIDRLRELARRELRRSKSQAAYLITDWSLRGRPGARAAVRDEGGNHRRGCRPMTTPRIEAAVAELAAALTEAIHTSKPANGAAPKLLDIPSACRALGGISRAQFYKLLAAGQGPRTINVGRRRMVVEASLADFVAGRQ